MSNIFLTSDLHIGHSGVTRFLNNDGTKLRPWNTAGEMDEALIERWNKVVRPKDKVYNLGDVVINRKALKTLERLNGDKVLIRGNHDCVDSQTECLTGRGWMPHENVLKDDLVFSFNPSTKRGEWKPITGFISKYHDGAMWNLDTERMSMSVTENHRVMLKKTANGAVEYEQPGDIRGLMYLQTASACGLADYEISDAYLRAMAWYYTDGSFNKHKGENTSICFWQSKIGGIARLEGVLEDAGIGYTKTSRGTTEAGTVVCGKALVKESLEAFVYRVPVESSKNLLSLVHKERYTLPVWVHLLSDRQAKVFVEELIAGDGSWGTGKNTTAAVLYGRLEFLEQVQSLCVTKGINANLSVFRGNDHRLNINFGKNTKVYAMCQAKKLGKWSKVAYSGIVWCLSTEHTNFMVRRKGQTFFTGNCFQLKDYTPYFRDIRGVGVLDSFVLTHIPVHPSSIERWKGNFHGHLHSNRVMTPEGGIDERYLCLCVEHTDFQPIALEDAKKRFEEQQ